MNIFGRTFKWNETGWITPNGTKLDFSDRRWGGTGGYRTEDHESIWEAYPEEGRDINGKDAEVDFMARGGIRVLPESGGINLSTQPTEQQKTILKKEYCKEVHIMNKEAIIRKLTSRKLWVAVAGFVSGLIVALDGDAETAETISALILQGASVLGYLIAEGLADSAHAE